MATKNRQSQLRRGLPLFLSLLTAALPPAYPGDIDPSRYAPFSGDRFYLLSEATFNSGETARIRLEAPGRQDYLKAYSGADIRIYRIPSPLAFLGKQKNLHRPSLQGGYTGEGPRNVLSYLWDNWYKKSRLIWQRVLSSSVREKAVASEPDLKQAPPHTYRTNFRNDPQFGYVPGLPLLDEFRYPIWEAAPLQPPAGVALAGSSSNFIGPQDGKVAIPLGKLAPGLYLAEAIIGTFRASCFVFVSNTVAITKVSGGQLFVWSVDKRAGKPVPGTRIVVTDGVGTVASGTSTREGIFTSDYKKADRNYVIGEDKDGGVFVSENFYYDSEIQGDKLYMFTDRPLYRPGDTVRLKAVLWKSADSGPAAEAASGKLLVKDSAGIPIFSRTLTITPGADGGSSDFTIPEGANPGGYTLELTLGEARYTAAMRVANYTRPHFELDITFDRSAYRTQEPIQGHIRATYPDGAPVPGARLELEVRRQRLTMVRDEIRSADRFPVKVSLDSYLSDKSGGADFQLPAVTEPSRYILNLKAVDGSAFRVSATRELTVASPKEPVLLKTKSQYSTPGEKVVFALEAAGQGEAAPRRWEAIRLQDQARSGGAITDGDKEFPVVFARPGAYTVSVLDKDGLPLGTLSHWVQGAELADIPGGISIVPDKDEYEPGGQADVLITFSTPVADALITLERDRVERYSLLSRPAPWLRLQRLSDREWRAGIAVDEDMGPSITLSAAYVKDGRYNFENKGLRVAAPRLQIRIAPDKTLYAPKDRASVDIYTTFKGKPVPASLSVSVVDEMVYVLQPEIAPDIADFFHHARRNQVRTSSSLSFYSFDSAFSASGAPASSVQQERSLKLRERPRREDKDTAHWEPLLKTDDSGHASFSFDIPDSVARWRITARGLTAAGNAGQKTLGVNSIKDIYLKWSGPTAFRKGDEPEAGVIAFNMTSEVRPALFKASGPGIDVDKQVVYLKPGSNFLSLPLKAGLGGTVNLQLVHERKQLDSLAVDISVMPSGWLTTRSVPLKAGAAGSEVPDGATNIRLTVAPGLTAAFLRAVDYLADYPYGCVEQVSSRLLPLSLAYSLIPGSGLPPNITDRLADRLAYERVRLVKMAGPQAAFSWWGNGARASAFLTAYAYYADKSAAAALNFTLPDKHWEHVLDVYKDNSEGLSVTENALTLWLMSELGLPTGSMVQGALENLSASTLPSGRQGTAADNASQIMGEDDGPLPNDLALVLLSLAAEKQGAPLSNGAAAAVQAARATLEKREDALSQAASLLAGHKKDERLAEAILNRSLPEEPTMDRSLTLALLYKAMGWNSGAGACDLSGVDPGPDWVKAAGPTGLPAWRYAGEIKPRLQIPEALAQKASLSAQLLYDIPGKETSLLPATITRRLYRLEQQQEPFKFKAVPVENEWQVNISDLYMDELEISPEQGRVFSFGLLEAALPPGAAVDETTWGMKVETANGEVPIGAEGLQAGERSYSVPFEKLSEPGAVRHLLRFSQAGIFSIPPARFFRMYSPSEKAFEGGDETALRKIIVR